MSIKVVRAGRDGEEPYGDGVIVLSVKEAIELAKELLDAVREALEEKEETTLEEAQK